MTGFVLEVSVPSESTFYAYWYGTGEIVGVSLDEHLDRLIYKVDYGTDGYRCRYQADRFLSGLHFATVLEYETDSSFDCDYCGERHSPSAGYPLTGCPSA